MIENIQDKYNNPDPRIKAARAYSDTLNLHVNGIGLQEALARINNYENEGQAAARQKHAISNKFITDRLLRPTDNVFSAKGGFSKYIFDANNESLEAEFREKLNDVYSGYSLSQYIHRIWFNKYIVDPNGLMFMEVSEDEDNPEIYPTYKSIHSIRNYKQDGIKVSWVIFEPDITVFDDEKKPETKTEMFWAVDENNYYRCKATKSGVEVIETKEHQFGFVPAIICSDIEDHVTGWKKSPIDQQVELLHKFMVDNSVLNIVEFLHSYPVPWEYVDECNICHGQGIVHNDNIDRSGDANCKCPSCGGDGMAKRKDPTDVKYLKPPSEGEQRIDPAQGYAYLPVDAWKLKVDSVDRVWNTIIFSHWGTSLEYGGGDSGNQYATATGRFIDAQPVNNKLTRYTESVELIHNGMAELYGKFYYPSTFKKSMVVYGRRYLTETPDQLMTRYSDFANLSDNPVMLEITFDQYLESAFRDNDILLEYHRKIAALDPFPHYKLADIKEILTPEELKKKLFLIEFKNTLSIGYVTLTKFEELKVQYDEFLKNKNIRQVADVNNNK